MAQIVLELMDQSPESFQDVVRLRQDPGVPGDASISSMFDIDSFRWRFFLARELPPLFIRVDGERAGYIRFRPILFPGVYELSILLLPKLWGQGIADRALKTAEEYAELRGATEIRAYVARSNPRSVRFFEKMGYQYRAECPHPYDVPGRTSPLLLCEYIKSFRKSSSVFIVAEIGSNWLLGSRKKSREAAKTMIEMAASSGCDAVKFQLYRADELYAASAGVSSYLARAGIEEEISAVLQEHEVPFDDIAYLAQEAQRAGVEFMATAFSAAAFSAIDPFVMRHKIASYEISCPDLLDLAAGSQKPLIVSTGAASLGDIDWAVRRLQSNPACGPITLLQCTAAYPAPPEDANVASLQMLRSVFGLDVGLSDHTRDPLVAPVLAIGFGAKVIEKHVTLSRSLPGPDHAFALEPAELSALVSACRQAEKMVGAGQKKVLPSEKELFFFAQRALQATVDIGEGETILLGRNAAFLRPGNQKKGAHPSLLSRIDGKPARRRIGAGEGIGLADVVS